MGRTLVSHKKTFALGSMSCMSKEVILHTRRQDGYRQKKSYRDTVEHRQQEHIQLECFVHAKRCRGVAVTVQVGCKRSASLFFLLDGPNMYISLYLIIYIYVLRYTS